MPSCRNRRSSRDRSASPDPPSTPYGVLKFWRKLRFAHSHDHNTGDRRRKPGPPSAPNSRPPAPGWEGALRLWGRFLLKFHRLGSGNFRRSSRRNCTCASGGPEACVRWTLRIAHNADIGAEVMRIDECNLATEAGSRRDSQDSHETQEASEFPRLREIPRSSATIRK